MIYIVTDILHTDIKNVYLNAIIQQKYSKCKSNNKNIDFICNSNGIFQKNEEIFNIDIFDICTIIGDPYFYCISDRKLLTPNLD